MRVVQKQGKIYLPDRPLQEEQAEIDNSTKTKSYLDEKRKLQRLIENNTSRLMIIYSLVYDKWYDNYEKNIIK